MNIAQILTLPDGISGIDCSGIATYVQPIVNRKGTTDGRDWSFWTQFIVLKDKTGDIDVSLNLGEESYLAVVKGDTIFVEKGTVSSYKDKKDKLRKSLQASLVVSGAPPQGREAPQQGRQAPKPPQTGQSSDPALTARLTAAMCGATRFAGISIENGKMAAELAYMQAVSYFIATGFILADKEKIDNEERQAAADISSPPQREPGDDEPPPDDNVPY